MASTEDVSGSVLDNADVRPVEVAPPEGGLSAAALGDKEGLVQVGRGGRPGHVPSPRVQEEDIDHTFAFKLWARGRCFRCLECDHQVSACLGTFRCI